MSNWVRFGHDEWDLGNKHYNYDLYLDIENVNLSECAMLYAPNNGQIRVCMKNWKEYCYKEIETVTESGWSHQTEHSTSVNYPLNVQAWTEGGRTYTPVNVPVYEGVNYRTLSGNLKIFDIGILIFDHDQTSFAQENATYQDSRYVSLLGSGQEFYYLLEHGGKPCIDWKIYCYNKETFAIFDWTYDYTIYWKFRTPIEVTWTKVYINLVNYITGEVEYAYTLDALPNTFTISKNIIYKMPIIIKGDDTLGITLQAEYYTTDPNNTTLTRRAHITTTWKNPSYYWVDAKIDDSTVEFIYQNPKDDEDYNIITADSDDSDNPSIINPSLIVSNVGCGASMYAMTKTNFSALVNWLWTSSFIDNIKLINNSPIENIISAQLFPFTISNLADTTITLGNVDTPIQGEVLPSTFNKFHRQLVTSYKVESFYNNFLDFSPYTSISIYLPYIGIKPLDTNMINGKTLDVYYTFDLSSGACVASIYVDGNVLYMFEGQIGINLPLSASNRAQVDATYVAIGASAVMSIASAWIGAGSNIATAGLRAEQATEHVEQAWETAGMVAKTSRTSAAVASGKTVLGSLIDSANVQFHTYTQGTFSPNTWGLLPKDVFMIYNRPTYQDIDTFRHVEGRHCMLSRRIGGLTGYTEVHSSIDLSSIPCDEELKARLKEILVGGFIA